MSIVLFTVIDLETAGLAPPASVIEIGWTKVFYDTETKRVEVQPPQARLFRPTETLSSDNIAIHHLTNEMLADYETCEDDALAAVAGEDKPQFLVAANCAFERQWFVPALTVQANDAQPHWICTVKAAARLHPDAPSHSNQAMRYELGLDLPEALAMPPHRAGPDSFVTAHILKAFIERGVRVADMVRWQLEPRFMTKLGFGKHKGVAFADAPADYLQWMCGQADMDADAKHWASLELDRRRNAA